CSKRLRRKPVFFNKKRSLKLQQISLERKSKGCLNTFETASFLFEMVYYPENQNKPYTRVKIPSHRPISIACRSLVKSSFINKLIPLTYYLIP
ncbi:MAG: hypothetical protein WBH03_04595, partial [Cyclobacteriaceae bacterium]